MKTENLETYEPTRVALVNTLLEQSFGKRFRGDYHLSPSSGEGAGWLFRGDNLDIITKLTPFLSAFNFIPGVEKQAGRFLDAIGSKIQIREKFHEHAKRYSELYQATFGKKVDISLDYRVV